MTDKERIEELQRHCGLPWKELAVKIGVNPQTFTDIRGARHGISKGLATKIMAAFPELRQEWVVLGEGTMTRQQPSVGIPLYDTSQLGAQAQSRIDVGSCFPGAEMAIRNTSDSMAEYPVGSILILKRVGDKDLLVPGTDYVVETKDFCVVKRLQKASRADRVTLYSTSSATYPDGRLVHEPFEIPMDSVLRIFAILGYVYSRSNEMAMTSVSQHDND